MPGPTIGIPTKNTGRTSEKPMGKKSRQKLSVIIDIFKLPIAVLIGIILSLISQYIFHQTQLGKIVLLVIVAIGSYDLFRENILMLLHKKFALDYIAMLAIIVSLVSGEYLVAAIIVLMLAGGIKLEQYGSLQAKRSLTALVDRLPNKVTQWIKGSAADQVVIGEVKIGTEILVRKGEVVPLDGIMVSPTGLTDESSLTGEPYMMDKVKGDIIRSGTVNVGEIMVVRVTKKEMDSTYYRIIKMVKAAQEEKTPFIRLADRYSTVFTIVTLAIAVFAYLISHQLDHVLAVLVIATPCPLILATPIALMGGMNAAAKKRIIMKRLASIEVLSRVGTIVFDKTGTITLGRPFIKKLTILDESYTHEQLCGIAEAIERNSLHPLAKAIVEEARKKKHPLKYATGVKEIIGSGITGEVDGQKYTLAKLSGQKGMMIQITKNNKRIGVFEFEDRIKENSKEIISKLRRLGLELFIYTGDKKEAALEVVKQLGSQVEIKAECTPEDKKRGIEELKNQGKVTAMIGDGINDAPALALADCGMVFSNEEQTAASEAADVVFLGGDFSSVLKVIDISKKTITIALQSILFGIGISTAGMLLAAFGIIPPVAGAFFQETIDILVIINALRASRQ